MVRRRSSLAKNTKVQSKTCWDHNQSSAEYSLDYIKNTHIKLMNKPRSQLSRMIHIRHPIITVAPSQMQPFIHYYPIKNGEIITSAAQNSFFKAKQQTILSKNGVIQISKDAVTKLASSKANNLKGNAKKRSRIKARIHDAEESEMKMEPKNKRLKVDESKIVQCFQKALNDGIKARETVSMTKL